MRRRSGARLPGVVLAAVSALIVGLVIAPSAAADTDTLPPNLDGESFFSADTWGFAERIAGQCDPDGPTTFEFTTSGSASGPYPGTFTEQVTAVVEPDPNGEPRTNYGLEFPAHRTTGFHSTFTIDSPAGTVTGTKDIVMGGNSSATCGRVTGTATYNNTPYPDSTVYSASFNVSVTYTATIRTATGVYRDSGRSNVGFSSSALNAVGVGSESTGFGEFYHSPQPVVPLGPATVTLTPPDAVNRVGTSHVVTATVDNAAGTPVAAAVVLFSVEGSMSTGGTCTTDDAGQCSFSYQGPDLPGADQITACADANGNGAVDAGEPCNTATKAWILPDSTPGHVTGGGQVFTADRADKIAFGFNARSGANGLKGECTVVDSSTDTMVKCLDVTTLTQAGGAATLFGNATINGTPTRYRIDVGDNGEPGAADTFRISTASGYSADGVITGGNIQVH